MDESHHKQLEENQQKFQAAIPEEFLDKHEQFLEKKNNQTFLEILF